jgi:predicted nucleotidyltransferase
MSPVQNLASDMCAAIVAAAQPRRIILFGSRASGTATEDSDFDLMVVEDQPVDRYREMVRLRGLLRSFRVPLDLVVVSEEKYQYWRDTPGNVYHEAATNGVTLYEAA